MRLTPLVFALTLAPPAMAEVGQDIHSFTLDNGMHGVVIEDRRAPVVTNMVWYRVGSADEPPGQSGVAHFLEHLMFKATDELSDGEFSRVVSANGGDDNAFTSTDYTAYFQRIAADRLEIVMAMEADRMTDLDPTPEGVLSERDVVLEERRQVVENDPGGPFNEQLRATMYLNHPYAQPVIGWHHEIETFDYDKALAFYRAHYAPNNAILVVAGDVDAAEVEALARKHFGQIPASDAIEPRVRPQEPPQISARRVEYRDERVREPYVLRQYLAPARRSGDQEQAAALYVLAELLGGSGITSTLAQALEIADPIAIDTGAFYSDVSLDPRGFGVYVVPRPDVSLAQAEARLDALLAEFAETGPDLAALERIKRQIAAAQIYELDSQNRRARTVGAALSSGLTLEDVAEWPDLLKAVSADDVQTAAAELFRPELSTTGWLMQAGAGADGALVQ